MKGQQLSKLFNKNGISTKHDLLKPFLIPGLLFKSAKYKIGKMSGGAAQQTNRKEILGEILGDQYILNYTNGKKGKTITKHHTAQSAAGKTFRHNSTTRQAQKLAPTQSSQTIGTLPMPAPNQCALVNSRLKNHNRLLPTATGSGSTFKTPRAWGD